MNSADMTVASALAPAPNDPPMKSSCAENSSALRVAVPLRSSAAVIDATPSLPAGSLTDPAFTSTLNDTSGTSRCSMSSSVIPFFSTTFL